MMVPQTHLLFSPGHLTNTKVRDGRQFSTFFYWKKNNIETFQRGFLVDGSLCDNKKKTIWKSIHKNRLDDATKPTAPPPSRRSMFSGYCLYIIRIKFSRSISFYFLFCRVDPKCASLICYLISTPTPTRPADTPTGMAEPSITPAEPSEPSETTTESKESCFDEVRPKLVPIQCKRKHLHFYERWPHFIFKSQVLFIVETNRK